MEEIELVATDIEAAVRAGAGGVVIGALTPAGEALVPVAEDLVHAAEGARVVVNDIGVGLDGSPAGGGSARRMFERDKDILRQIGVPLRHSCVSRARYPAGSASPSGWSMRKPSMPRSIQSW